MTAAAQVYAAALKSIARRPKFGNRKVTVDGLRFDSQREALRWLDLQMLERAGKIGELRRQCRFPLEVNSQHVCFYVADFTYRENGELIVEDAKGVRTDVFVLKSKLMKACLGHTVREV